MRSYRIFEGRSRPLIMSHRGSCRSAPENTLSAFRRAFAERTDILETDVHVTADGEFALIHDDLLDRTTEGRGPVAERTASELSRLRADRGWSGFEGDRIPLLEDLLSILPAEVALVLELKSDRFLEPGVPAKLANRLQATGVLGRTGVISFSEKRLRALKSEVPSLPAGLVSLTRAFPPRGLEMAGPFWPLLLLNPLYIPLAHRRDMLVAPLDPFPDNRLWLYRRLGCDAVLTSDPAETRRHLESLDHPAAAKGSA